MPVLCQNHISMPNEHKCQFFLHQVQGLKFVFKPFFSPSSSLVNLSFILQCSLERRGCGLQPQHRSFLHQSKFCVGGRGANKGKELLGLGLTKRNVSRTLSFYFC